ncbi:hypothetical protein [Pseudobacillus badius]|uniref:hypothetical protein n=1 Tax=Bacillus badius TaxID=1455 RepID=UPI0007B0B7DA|nr:hypothetical protein [Bacillus badius]KZO00618.1 hypothetical protein A4244_14995 [Bacillus badius]OCS87859.1 hypothetical protein A6M11_15015 [Bacillus badius]OVE47187.1 hypothetical protein B1A98_18760 [Bacillus badius]TDV98985.1 hypothetical protein B0G66_12316 [Bacillus badius]
MKLTLEENLPNLIQGAVNKLSIETDYVSKESANDIVLTGKFIITREIKTKNRVTEIKDRIPVEITIPKKKLIKKTAETSLHLKEYRFGFEGDCTLFEVEAEITNVADDIPETLEIEDIFEKPPKKRPNIVMK